MSVRTAKSLYTSSFKVKRALFVHKYIDIHCVSVLFLVIEGGISLQSRTDRDSTSVTFGVDIVLSVFACGFSFFSALLYLMGRTH